MIRTRTPVVFIHGLCQHSSFRDPRLGKRGL